MTPSRFSQVSLLQAARKCAALLCVTALLFGDGALVSRAQEAQPAAATLPADELDSLVAPIALYPDPLLSQVLVASTYPLEVVQLQQWLGQHKDLKDKALADAVAKQNWDPSIQALAALPDVVKQLADNIKWTTDLGNAVLAQESDVMDAVQRMRQKAQSNGNLKSSDKAKVETQVIQDKSVIVIEQTNPEVVYVPSYNPTVVYGAAPYYPYPPLYYPTGGLVLSFGIGVAMGAFWSGGWGWGAGWGGGSINVNNNNTFVRNSNRNNGNVGNGNRGNGNRGNSNWQHNPKHRGGAPYPSQGLASKYGGTTRGGQGQRGQSGLNGGAGRNGGGFSGGGGDRVGNRQVPNSPGATNRGAFSGAGSRSNGSSARASSSRGSSSMRGGGSRGGGGGRRGR
jgi:Protein of unknown function (DUF3300)